MSQPINAYCLFKTPEIEERTNFLCDQAVEVLNAMAVYCQACKLPLVITDSVSTLAEDQALSRVSDEHRQARAFDLSIHDWLPLAIGDFIEHFEEEFESLAAVGLQTGRPHLIFQHNNGHGSHLHVQVARRFAVNDPLGIPTQNPILGA